MTPPAVAEGAPEGSTATRSSEVAERENVTLRQWIAVFGAIAGSFVAVLNIQITNASLREIQGALSATLTEASWITTAYVASSLVSMPLTGWFVRVFSVRTYVVWNIALFMISVVGCALAWDLEAMIGMRFISGFFGGALIPMSMYIVLITLPVAKRPVAFMFWGIAIALAPSMGPALGGWLTEEFSWTLVFYVQLIPSAFVLAALFFCLDPSPRQLALLRRVNWLSIMFMAAGLLLLIIVLEEGNRNDWFESQFITRLAVISAVLLTVFLVVQLFHRDPYINLRLYARRDFLLCCIVAAAFGVGVFGAQFTVALYLIQVPQYTAGQVGTVLMWIGFPQFVSGLLVLWLIPRVDNRMLMGFGCALFAASCFLNIGMSYDTGYWDLMVINVIRGFGQPFIMVVVAAVATAAMEASNQGSASALINWTRDLAGAVAIASLKTGIVRRSEFHADHVSEHVSSADPETASRLELLTQRFLDYTGDLQQARDQAVAALNTLVERESLIMAYNDMFYGIGIVFVIATLACFLIRRPARRGG